MKKEWIISTLNRLSGEEKVSAVSHLPCESLTSLCVHTPTFFFSSLLHTAQALPLPERCVRKSGRTLQLHLVRLPMISRSHFQNPFRLSLLALTQPSSPSADVLLLEIRVTLTRSGDLFVLHLCILLKWNKNETLMEGAKSFWTRCAVSARRWHNDKLNHPRSRSAHISVTQRGWRGKISYSGGCERNL